MSFNNAKSESAAKLYKYECLDCENYKRKVKEAEQTASGRDVLIQMLQEEIKKLEKRYKELIDDYELLRFKHCTVVQELSNFKEIHRKLEDSNMWLSKKLEAKNQQQIIKNDMEKCKNQCKEMQTQWVSQDGIEGKLDIRENSLHQNILKEVMNIEVLMQNQNETVKDVLMKVLEEMQDSKQGKQLGKTTTSDSSYKDIKDISKVELLSTVDDLKHQRDAQNNFIEKLRAENESIKTQLEEKKANLAQCLDVLQDNHLNLNSLSGNIEIIINEKESYLKEISHLKNIAEENNKALKEKDQEIYELKRKADVTDNQSETSDLKQQNRDLNKALKECQQELEQLQAKFLSDNLCNFENCSQLAKVILEQKAAGSRNSTKIMDKKISSVDQGEIKIMNEKIKSLEQELKQTKLENNEYEEENKYYRQKFDDLTSQLQTLERENYDSENLKIAQLTRDLEKLNTQKDNEIAELKEEINNFKENNYFELQEKYIQIEYNLKIFNQENAKLVEEKDYLQNQLGRLQQELTVIQEGDEKHILMLTDLEKLNTQKDNEIKELKDEINNFKKNNYFELQEKYIQMEDNLKILNQENDKLVEEKDDLQNQLVSLQQELTRIQEGDEKHIIMLTDLEKLNTQKDNEIKELKDEINNFKKNNYSELQEKYIQMENNLKIFNQENAKLLEEKDYLQNQLVRLQQEITHIQEGDEKHILMLHEKINNLENFEFKKQVEIDQCCCVVKNIKETIADKTFITENSLARTSVLENQKRELEKVNQQLQEQIEATRAELEAYKHKYENCDCNIGKYNTEMNNMGSVNVKLQNDVRLLEVELCRLECLNQQLVNDNKEMEVEICRRQCAVNHLEQCLDKSNKILAECEKEIKEIHFENEGLKIENLNLKKDLQKYNTEKGDLQETVSRITRQSQELELEKFQLSKTLVDKSNFEEEFNELKKKHNNLLKTLQENDTELIATRKQVATLQNALEAAKKENDQVIKTYKDVQGTLSEEIRKYKEEIKTINKNGDTVKLDVKPEFKCVECLNVNELKAIMAEKEKTVKILDAQNKELALEVAQLKSYVNRLINDNKNLRTAIDNLLATLVEKLKHFTDNQENVSIKSNELIVNDILNSLIDLEHNVMDPQSVSCAEKCNCMSVIMSTYKMDANDSSVTNIPPCKMKCGRRIKDGQRYSGARTTGSMGIRSFCAECCGGRERGQDDQPESDT